MMESKSLKEKIEILETQMTETDFWIDTEKAKEKIKEYESLKEELRKEEQILRVGVIVNIFSGAGGDDAEDWSRILFEMYTKFASKNGYSYFLIDSNENTHGGFRSISFEIDGKGLYGLLKNESGVHRLIRQSPFNAKALRQTSFSYVEVLPILPKEISTSFKESDVEVISQKSGGPGGQNVNKRETAIRAVHTPSGISVLVSTERSQAQNKEIALQMLKAKIYKQEEERQQMILKGVTPDFDKGQKIEWGSQIRTYTLHPYKLVKDHRTNIESSDVESVLSGEKLDIFFPQN